MQDYALVLEPWEIKKLSGAFHKFGWRTLNWVQANSDECFDRPAERFEAAVQAIVRLEDEMKRVKTLKVPQSVEREKRHEEQK